MFGTTFKCRFLSLVGAATSIIFVATNTSLSRLIRVCSNKTRLLLRQKYGCRDKVNLIFVAKNVCRDKRRVLSRQIRVCRYKHVFVATKLLSRQNDTSGSSRQRNLIRGPTYLYHITVNNITNFFCVCAKSKNNCCKHT